MSNRTVLLVAAIWIFWGAAAPERSGSNIEELTRRVIQLTNVERADRGFRPLTVHPRLQDAATWLATDMAAHQSLSHTDSTGRRMTARLIQFGYANAQIMAENIAVGPTTAQEAVQLWMQSTQHRHNLLHPDVREIGVGYAVDSRTGQSYWVQDFGSRFDGS